MPCKLSGLCAGGHRRKKSGKEHAAGGENSTTGGSSVDGSVEGGEGDEEMLVKGGGELGVGAASMCSNFHLMERTASYIMRARAGVLRTAFGTWADFQ